MPPPDLRRRTTPAPSSSDRDKFVAFAFCNADALIELDVGFHIAFTAGAVEPLVGRKPDSLITRLFTDLVRPEDRPYVLSLLRRCAGGERLDEAPVQILNGPGQLLRVSMSGYVSRKLGGHLFLALRKGVGREDRSKALAGAAERAISASEQAEMEAFSEVLEDRLEALLEGGAEVKMTMIDLGETDALRERMGGRGWRKLQMELADAAMAASVDGAAAGMLGEGRIGIIQRADADIAAVEARINQSVKQADPTGAGLAISASTMALDATALSDAEAINALVYTVKQMSSAPREGEAKSEDMASLSVRMADTARRIAQVKAVVSSGDWDIAYQPIVDLANQRLHHVEALVRFREREWPESPFETIRFAEDVGLICDFDMQIIRDVIARVTSKSAQPEFQNTAVAVNVSGRSFGNERFITTLTTMLKAEPELAKSVLFEITESARIENLDEANKVVQNFRSLGYKVCLDDFGVGESAFEYLRAFEIDYVKIDGSYIDLAMREEKGRAFIVAISILCGTLGIATVAERIEDERQLPFLRRCGIAYGQGYLFGKPQVQPAL